MYKVFFSCRQGIYYSMCLEKEVRAAVYIIGAGNQVVLHPVDSSSGDSIGLIKQKYGYDRKVSYGLFVK